jgi:PAS domain S-box-containing protein
MKKSTKSFQTNEEIDSAQSNPIQSEKDGSPCGNKKILIIEDDAGIAELIRDSLEEKKYQITWVENFDDADRFLQNEEPVLMIVDYRIAGGENAEEWIVKRKNNQLPVPPFIMSTGQGDERIAVQLMKLGARDYLIKDSHFLEILPYVVNKVCDEIYKEHKLIEAEKALSQSEEKYRLLLENSELGVGLFDLNGKILLYNQKAVENLGGKVEDYVGKTLIECFGKEAGGLYTQRIHETVKNGKSIEFEDFVTTLSGGYWFVSNHACIKNTKGEIIGVQIIAHDITERKRNEEEIKRISNHFQAIIEKANDGIIVLDAQNNVKYVSQNALKMFGYENSEIKPFDPNELTHPDDLPVVLDHLYQLISNPDYTPTLEYRFKHQKGEWIWIESTFTNLFANPDVQGLVINFREITERKRNEQNLIESKNVLNKLLLINSELIESTSNEINFSKLTDTMTEISGAKYAAFNLFDDNGLDFTTVAFSGLSDLNTVSMAFLGVDLINKKWKHDPLRAEKIVNKELPY